MPDRAPDLDEILARWCRGEASAAEELYRRYYDRALNFALRLMGREVEAVDIARHALAAGLEGVRKGARPDDFTNWILGIVRHEAARDWRHRGRERSGLEGERVPVGGSPATEFVRLEMSDLLQKAHARLSDDDREIVRLRIELKLKREEAAKRLGLPVRELDRQLERILFGLREALSRHFTTLVLSRAVERRKRTVTLEKIAQLRPSFRRAFELRHLEGRSLEETAATLALPVETVRVRLDHAYEQLGCSAEDDFDAVREAYRAGRS